LPAEWLDALPAASAEARASRRDLRIFNAALRNEAWLGRVVRTQLRPGERVLEFGAGDGALARRMTLAGLPWDALDLAPPPENWPRAARWLQADARDFSPEPAHAVLVANLFCHHFDAPTLAELGARWRDSARVLAIGELRRGRGHEWLFRIFARAIGAHAVSRHDGRLSIRAGFRGDELARALGLDLAQWRWRVSGNLAGAYRLFAERRT
jgi:hypothetical protein